MELLQCANSPQGRYKRDFRSEDREMSVSSGGSSVKSTTPRSIRAATLSGSGGFERRVSLPSGHYAATLGPMSKSEARGQQFRHYGSSLSLAEEHGKHELTSRTLRPPSPTTLRKSSTNLPPSAAMNKSERSPRPSLPNMRVELESPKLADYLERPRLVSAIMPPFRNEAVAATASAHHAKRYEKYENKIEDCRNLRLGNFIEEPEDDEIIPERLRQYYLNTYLNVCDICEAINCPLTHRGM